MARDSFIDALGTAEERWKVHQARPTTLNDALGAAVEQEAFFAADKQRGGSVRALQLPIEKPVEDLKKELAELKAMVQQLASQKNSRPGTRPTIECWSCGQKGHIQRNCQQPKRQQQGKQQAGNGNLSGSGAKTRQEDSQQ